MSDLSIPTDILQVHSHAGAADFDEFYPLSITNYSEIRLFTRQDFINLEYDDSVLLTFTPNNGALIPSLEAQGEYIRDTATVNIIDDDNKNGNECDQCMY